MIRLEAIQQFTLKDFDKLTNIKRKTSVDTEGQLIIGDTFECDEKMAKYLMGNNDKGVMVAKIIEYKPIKEEIKEEPIVEKKEKPSKKKKNAK